MSDHHKGPMGLDARIAGAAREGCAESRLLMSRRSMLGITASLFSSAFLPNFASAATDPDARFLVVVLRGGMDGIGMVVPKTDPFYESSRQQLAIPASSTLSLGTDFGLHPALARVHTMFNDGDAAFVPAAGIPLRNRSHFECQDNLENGLPVNTSNQTGWLNRLLGSLPEGDPIRVAKGLEIGEAPLILSGPEPVLGWSPTWFEKSRAANVSRLEAVYTQIDPELWDSLSRGLEADALALAAGAGQDNVSVLRKGFIGAGRLLRATTGPRIAVLSVGGWDTHSQQADADPLVGQMADRMADLDEALGDLKTELGTAWDKTVCICVTEFGRTIDTNGDDGTDHGIGTTSFMVGGAVQGGFIGDWPGLSPAARYEGDLYPATDLRAVFKSVLNQHIGVPQTVLDDIVFPGSAGVTLSAKVISGPKRAERLVSSFRRPLTLQEVSPIAKYRRRHGLDG